MNLVNYYIHETLLSWKDRKHKKLTKYNYIKKTKKEEIE